MSTFLIIAGAVILIIGLLLFNKGAQSHEGGDLVVPTQPTEEPVAVEQPTVVVDNVVVEPTKEAKPKKAPQAKTGTAKKKPASPPKAKQAKGTGK